MAFPFVTVPAFPNVPPFPGVPPIPRNPLTLLVAPQITRLLTDASIVTRLLGFQNTPSWGIWDASGTAPVIIGDSVVETEYDGEYSVTDAPVEQGQFVSYNRIRRPVEMIVTMTKGGPVSERTAFYNAIETAKASTKLFTVVVPENTYPAMNVYKARWDRSQEQGAQLIKVEVFLREIVQSASALFSDTQSPAAAAQVNIGAVQAQPPPLSQDLLFGRSIR